MEESEDHTRIQQWAEQDRPREKLLLKGKSALSDAELISILIGSGTSELSAVELSRSILNRVNHNLHGLARMTVGDLTRFKGIGKAKALSIISAMELARRKSNENSPPVNQISSSEHAYQALKPALLDQSRESFWILLLNRANHVLGRERVSKGGLSGTVADPKVIFKIALEYQASSIILAHNHPSGNPKPSEADIRLTRKLKEAGKLLDIPVLDHIIFTDYTYSSFADEGLL